jgi:hypothetical protein
MSEPASKSRKGTPVAPQKAPPKAASTARDGTRGGLPGLMQSAGPALGLAVQRQVAVGAPDDRFEREADAAANRVTTGESVQPSAISPITPDVLAQTAAAPEAAAPEKKPETMPVQKKGASGPGSEERKPDAKPVQKAEAKPEEKKPEARSVQKAEAKPEEKKPDVKPVQKAEAKPEDKKPVQKDGAGGGAPSSSASDAASAAVTSKGVGKPIEPTTRSTLESRFGTDLGHVRVHDDAAAVASARALNARAFTHGSDIWLGSGASQSDMRLMAHEATHVVQQSGGVHRMVQRKNGSGNTGGAPAPGAPGGGSKVDHTALTIDIPELRVPKYERKAKAIPTPLPLPKKPVRPTDQRTVWAEGVLKSAGYAENVLKNIDRKRGVKSARTGKLVHVLKSSASSTYVIGDDDTLPPKLALPRWDKAGAGSNYDVDHIREMQLGGNNVFANMELLDASANRSSGSQIHNEIVSKLAEAVKPEVGKDRKWRRMPDLDKVQAQYQVTFLAVTPALDVAGDPSNYWSRDMVTGGDHVKPLKTLTATEISAKRLVGDETHLVVYPRPAGGSAKNIPWKPDTNTPENFKGKGIFKNFEAKGITYAPGAGGAITGTKRFGKDLLEAKEVGWMLNDMEGLDYTVYVDKSAALQTLKAAKAPGTSPVELSEVELDDDGGIMARGVLRSDLPLLKGIEIDISLVDDQLTLNKTFSGGELSLLGPIQITGSTLVVSAGTPGFSVKGDIDFEIERLGKGKISGLGEFGGASGVGFGIKGSFELDKKVFDGEARIEAGYEKEEFWAKGHLSISEGKVRGIKSASLDASYAKDSFSATGTITPDIPAVEAASLSVDYGPETGLKFAGDLSLRKDTPGIEGGSVHVEAMQPPGGEGFKVKASGSAKPKIPGFDTMLQVTYDEGTFDASVTAAYEKGRLKGSVLIGATNRPVADGKPAGVPPPKGDKLYVYGGGSVTVVIAPWLQGTVGVQIKPDGDIILSGEIALPSTLDVFPAKELKKNIFTIGIDIPIVGVAVAGQRIGIFANISGGLDVSAGIGPGQLQQLRLGITYSPKHEEDTRVYGDASLHVPAHAGLRLFVRGGLGAGIPIVSAQAGLEIGAELGLEGALDTGVHVDWTPAKGLTLDAEAEIHVEPKLAVDITGFVKVEADLFITTISLYEKQWQLAGFEYGSGLRFGVSFPVHYQEGQPFDLSLDKVKFQVPDIDPKAMLSDLIARIA